LHKIQGGLAKAIQLAVQSISTTTSFDS
jgi:hypothetical protein